MTIQNMYIPREKACAAAQAERPSCSFRIAETHTKKKKRWTLNNKTCILSIFGQRSDNEK